MRKSITLNIYLAIIFYKSVASGIENISNSSLALNESIKKRDVCDFSAKNITCIYKNEGTATLRKLFERLNSHFRIDSNAIRNISSKCKLETMRYEEGLKNFELWALKMYDANAKIPSGLLNGNINQFGDFDMCLSVKEKTLAFQGQYCLASLQVYAPKNQYLKRIHKLLHSHYMIKSELRDPGHRIPRFSSINWAFCVPSSCTARDVKISLRSFVDRIINGTDLHVDVLVDPILCQNANSKKIDFGTYVACAIFSLVILLSLISTTYDHYYVENKRELFVCFSLHKNISALLSTKRANDDIGSLHGIRFINAFMLIIAHKSMALLFVPYTNRTKMTEILGQSFTVFGRNASLYTDPFIMISGTLTTYNLMKKLRRQNKISPFKEYTSRLFRIIPTLSALILFCTFILPVLNTGPTWNHVVSQHADNCKKYWWRNLFFIHNYFGFKDMCLTHTHHIGIDTQLFFISVLVIPLLWKWTKKTTVVLIAIALFSTVLRYYITYIKRLSNFIHFGTSIKQLFDTADYMYILPLYRATVYVMGMFLAVLLQKYEERRLSKVQLRLGHAVAIFSFCVAFFGHSYMGSITYNYSRTDAAWYAAFAPIFWCFSFAWIIFTAHVKQAGIVGKILSNKIFLITTRLSYTIYLTQFPIFFYNVGVTRTSEYYNLLSTTFNVVELFWIIFFSAILTVLFEMPFQNIRSVLFNGGLKLKKLTD